MEPATRRKLAEFIRSEGLSLAEDPQRVRAMLMDSCPEARTEISLITVAAEDDIPLRLVRSSSDAVLKDGEIARAVADLQRSRRVDAGAAQWVVGSWAWALGLTGAEPEDAVADSVGSEGPTAPVSGQDAPMAGQSAPMPGSLGGAAFGAGSSWPPGAPTGAAAPPYPGTQHVGAPPGPWGPWAGSGGTPPMFQPPVPPQPAGPPRPVAPPPRPGQSRGLLIGLAAAAAAVVVLGLGAAVLAKGNGPSPTPPPPTGIVSSSSSASAQPVSFYILDTLGDYQLDETLDLFVNGTSFGEITLNQSTKAARLPLAWPRGVYTYDLQGTYSYRDIDNVIQQAQVHGSGTIDVEPGVNYHVETEGDLSNLAYTLRSGS